MNDLMMQMPFGLYLNIVTLLPLLHSYESFPNLDIFSRSVIFAGRHSSDPLNGDQTTVNTTKNSVFTIQMRSGCKCNEKLTAIRVGTTVCHGKDTSTGMFEIWMNFIGKRFAVNRSTTSSCSGRISSLNHEVINDAMKDRIIVVPSAGQFCKVATSVGCMIPIQLDHNLSH